MRLRDDIKLFEVGTDRFAVDMSADGVDYTHLYTMNDATAMLWEAFHDKDFTLEMMVEKLCAEYDVTPEVARKDISQMLSEWQSYGMMA